MNLRDLKLRVRPAFVDGCVRDVLYAFRTFRRAPLAALTIVTTVGLGLGLVAVVFTILNVFIFRVDEVHNPGELFGVERPRSADGSRVRFTWPQYEALRRESGVFSDAFAMLPDIDSRIDGRMMAGTLVTGNFFQVLRVEAALGRTLNPADDERFAGRPVMVLSHRGWSRHFASDPAMIGRSLLVSGVSYEIVGITTAPNVGRLVLSQSVYPVGFGLIAGVGLAAALGIVLMATPAASQIGEIVHVFDPVAYTGSLLCVVTACALAALVPALRAARIDPIATLRQD